MKYLITAFLLACGPETSTDLSTTEASSAALAQTSRFTYTFTGDAHLAPQADPCFFLNNEAGSGTSPQYGALTWSDIEVVNFCSVQAGVSVVSQFVLTNAAGDRAYGTFLTQGKIKMDDGSLDISGVFTFTSGSGAFAGVNGGGEITAHAAQPDATGVSHFTAKMSGLVFKK